MNRAYEMMVIIDGDVDDKSLIYSDITEFSQFDEIFMNDLTDTDVYSLGEVMDQ